MVNEISINDILSQSALWFPPEWVRASLVLALVNSWVVIGLFAYINHQTRQPYFRLWTVGWMFYSVYLAAAIGLEESPNTPLLMMGRLAFIGISALFMFWGSFQLMGRVRKHAELGLAIALMLVWSYVAAYKVREELWIVTAVFALLASAGVVTGLMYIRHRKRNRGGYILGTGFALWGLHLLVFPFLPVSPALTAAAYLTSAILALMITVGMVVEQEHVTSEHDYEALFHSAGDAIFLLEPGTLRLLEVNAAAERLTRREARDLIGRGFLELCRDFGDGEAARFDEQSLAQTPVRTVGEFHVAIPSGECVVCEGQATTVHCPKGPVLQINARDITERKQAERLLRESNNRLHAALGELRRAQQHVVQQERLNALGQMASGVAHDFNNVLAKVLGFSELLLARPENLNDSDKVKKYLQMINAETQDAVKVVDRLREFYRHRKETDVYTTVNLNQLIERAVSLTQPKWKNQAMASGACIRVDTCLGDIPRVRGSDLELRDVVMNLILNSADAMPQGGTITIRTHEEGGHAVVEVVDTGAGMTEETRRRCLEPFFTTKGESKTGLGLAIVYGIVQRHGGSIEIRSEVGQGTVVVVRLPAQKEQRANVGAPCPESCPRLRVLLVEDEPLLRDIEAEYLRGDGHFVETASHGDEALEKFRAGEFDLVVADKVIPDMNGEQVARAIRLAAPQVPIIMVTGFGEAPGRESDERECADLVLAKPVTQTALRQAIARVTATTINC